VVQEMSLITEFLTPVKVKVWRPLQTCGIDGSISIAYCNSSTA